MIVAFRRLLRAAALLLLACSTARGAATWYENYEAALDAISRGEYAVAESKLNAAIAEHPEPGRKVRTYGVRFLNMYVPEFHLGVIAHARGDYSGALTHFDRVVRTKVLQKGDSEFAKMEKMIGEAKQRVAAAAPPPPPTATPKTPTTAEEAAVLVRNARSLFEQGRMGEAKEALEQARRKDPAAPGVTELAGQMMKKEEEDRRKAEIERKGAEFQTLARQVEQAVKNREYGKAKSLAERALGLDWDAGRAKELLRGALVAEAVDALRRAVAGVNWTEAQRQFQEVTRLDAGNAVLRELGPQIERGLSGVTGGKLLEEGLIAFYSGDYKQSIALLERVSGGGEDQALAHFYVGCAYAGLAFRQTTGRQQLLSQARASFAESHRIEPGLKHDTRNISPRIIRLFAEGK